MPAVTVGERVVSIGGMIFKKFLQMDFDSDG